MYSSTMLREKLDGDEKLRNFLFRRGYVITNRNNLDLNAYPFYNNWTTQKINDYFQVYLHREQHFYRVEQEGKIAVLIGHAYNPYTMQISESDILNDCISAYDHGKADFFEKISELSGIHLIALFDEDSIIFVQDCCAMQSCYYGKCGSNIYFTSNIAIVEDVDSPKEDLFSQKLIHSRSYRHGSKYLPGDRTVYDGFCRLGPNVYLEYSKKGFHIDRFYPIAEHKVVEETDLSVVETIADMLQKSVSLCAQKWKKPAISLSGGMDSRTTLSSAKEDYKRFYYYSFHSKPQEVTDAHAAHSICEAIGEPHTIYPIADNNADCEDFELYQAIITRNSGGVSCPRDNEIRKYIFLSTLEGFDVELKSWASEIGRAFWGRRYGLRLPEKLTARHLSIFQTRYFGSPGLLRKSDRAYGEYMKKSHFVYPMFNYEATDIFYWEYRFGSWGTIVTTGQNIFNFEVTMPMNNRKIMDMFLWYPHEFRRTDGVHRAIIETNDKRLNKAGNNVHNDYMNKKRLLLERVYYTYRTMFYREKSKS